MSSGQPEGLHEVRVLILPGAADLDVALTLEIFRVANSLSGRSAVRVSITTVDDVPVTLTNGRVITPTETLGSLEQFNLSLVLSHIHPDREMLPRIHARVRHLSRVSSVMAAADQAPMLLASAGLLDGRTATCHFDLMLAAQETHPGVRFIDQLIVRDGDFLTCAGHLSLVDMLLQYIEDLMGPEFRLALAAELIAPSLRPSTASQRKAMNPPSATGDQRILQAIELMRDNIETPLSISAIAKRIGVSRRLLETLWQRSAGCSPQRFYARERINHACSLLLFSKLPVNEISIACGFSSGAAFSRAFACYAKISPREYRKIHGNKIAPAISLGERGATLRARGEGRATR